MSAARQARAGAGESSDQAQADLTEVYRLLFDRYGPQSWWPADTPFEVVTGAILTQSAAWVNVEKAIANLKQADVLAPAALRCLRMEELARLIYPSGYYNAKARKVRAFVERLGGAYGDSLDKLFALDIAELRSELLGIHGIGPETADSIILYAAGKPIFVIDTYTRRILSRLGLNPARDDYESFRALFMSNLPHDAGMFNEYHALLVRHGKYVCKRTPLCAQCCLLNMCPGQAPSQAGPPARGRYR